MAENGLVTGLDLPPTLYADMGGSLMASEAVLQAVLHKQRSGKGVYLEVALSSASAYLGLPRQWGMTQATGPVGGAHAGYRIYPCKDGRVAVAALEPHFAAALCEVAGGQWQTHQHAGTRRPTPPWPAVSPAEPAPSLTPWAMPGIFRSTP
jgi:alpha-methylacyl-CoA racemase